MVLRIPLARSATDVYPHSMARVLHWNGRSLPPELRELPAGDYVVSEYRAEKLTPDEELGLREALQSIDRGEAIPGAKVHAELKAMLKQRRRRRK